MLMVKNRSKIYDIMDILIFMILLNDMLTIWLHDKVLLSRRPLYIEAK